MHLFSQQPAAQKPPRRGSSLSRLFHAISAPTANPAKFNDTAPRSVGFPEPITEKIAMDPPAPSASFIEELRLDLDSRIPARRLAAIDKLCALLKEDKDRIVEKELVAIAKDHSHFVDTRKRIILALGNYEEALFTIVTTAPLPTKPILEAILVQPQNHIRVLQAIAGNEMFDVAIRDFARANLVTNTSSSSSSEV